MPGLSQLRKLSEDVLRLGNESKLRSERGEKPVVAVIPASIQDIDDSEDFVLGLPEKDTDEGPSEEELAQKAEEEAALSQAENELESLLAGAGPVPGGDTPDLSSILNPVLDAGDDIPDLSAFEEPPAPPKEPEPPSIEDMSLDDLLSMPSEDFSEPEPVPEPVSPPKPAVQADIPSKKETAAAEPVLEAEAIPDMEELSFDESESFEVPSVEIPEDDFSAETISSKDIPVDAVSDEEDEFAFSGDAIDLNADIPEELLEVPGDGRKPLKSDEPPAEPAAETEQRANESEDFTAGPGLDDFNISGDVDLPESGTDEIPTSGGFGFDALDTNGLDDFGAGLDSPFGDGSAAESEAPVTPGADSAEQSTASDSADMSDTSGMDSDFDVGQIDLSGLNIGGDDDGAEADGGAAFEENATPEVFDTSEMGGFNIDEVAGSGNGMSDFNIPDTDSKLNGGSDFELDSEGAGEPDFEIEGYTGIDANPFDKNGRVKTQIAEPEERKQKNTLTDAEYKRFKNNLKSYPLNVRIAVEDMIVKNEFTDDVIFEVIEKILKKIPARQLASHLEKMLDIQLSVPRDFERRTAEEYEAYKQSIQYQLKNRIIPAIIIGIFAMMLVFCTGYLSYKFVINPLIAEKYYKQGYALLENDEYPQSEIMFNKALERVEKKKWFFRYANGYRVHKQYDRAELMYKNILKRFKHDKQGGLEYAEMELYDIANYAKAEDLLKHEVLVYHINDLDAILLLGDVYLEWGTEEDYSKFELAFEQYSILLNLTKEIKNEYLARLMRYYVRTDNLKEVLQYKETFYPVEKSLSGDDWTEMSGYLMDKLYGDLLPQEEYLRSAIEDVHGMLKRAVKYSPANPIAQYNMARYYIHSGEKERSENSLKKTLELFDKAKNLKKRDVYKNINTFRLLGEQYINEREYILAEDYLSKGIDFFEDKSSLSGLESDKNVGIMYSDMADLNYFISGDLDAAERYYTKSINNKNDSSSLRYRIGYIQYSRKDYDSAFVNFVDAVKDKENDINLLLGLANTLSLREDDYASTGYYERLLNNLNFEFSKKAIILPQVDEEDTELVETYMKASNNLGVSQFRLARQTGNSGLNGESIFNFQNALRAYDSLTRNTKTMVRIGGTNLAEQNIKYVTSPKMTYEPAIFTEIPRTLQNEKHLE
ncbi:MAG: hypothetical protein KBT21_11875 [Treponema sp.]|nr:hypothetical protein [Candidatus Treponema merdequi]